MTAAAAFETFAILRKGMCPNNLEENITEEIVEDSSTRCRNEQPIRIDYQKP